jgi:hypothetical protein
MKNKRAKQKLLMRVTQNGYLNRVGRFTCVPPIVRTLEADVLFGPTKLSIFQ